MSSISPRRVRTLAPWLVLWLLILSAAGCSRAGSASSPAQAEAVPGAPGDIVASSIPAPTSAAGALEGTQALPPQPGSTSTAEPRPSTPERTTPDAGSAQPTAATPPRATPTPTASQPLSRTVNILLLGSDRRPNMPNWRTDVIMIIALDLDNGQAAAISLPRDLYLDEIPGHRPNKINVVDYLGERDEPGGGGPRLLARILQERLGIPIHFYLRFEFQGFEKVIDALGGLEIDIDCPAYEYLPEENIYLNLRPGRQTLTGSQALAYVRARNQGGDLERARRQQRVVWAVRNQILQRNLLPRIPALYAALRDHVQTDIGLMAAIRYARFALSLEEEDIHGMVVQRPLIQEGWRQGMFVFLADWEALAAHIQTVFDSPPLVETNTIEPPAPGQATESGGADGHAPAPRCP